jgi:ribosomal subunit interface protein
MTYTWHSTTKNIHADNLGLKFSRRLDLIKKHLAHFPEGTVHLDIFVEKNKKKDLYTAKLHLTLPSRVLNASKDADNMMTAFDHAADVLVREIEKYKSELRGEENWERRGGLHDEQVLWFQPVPQSASDQPVPEMLMEMLEQHRNTLVSHITRLIRRDETAGRIPPGSVTSDGILQRVIERALREYSSKPARKTYKAWFEMLAKDELSHRYENSRARPAQPQTVAA